MAGTSPAFDGAGSGVTPLPATPETRWLVASPHDRLLYARLRAESRAIDAIAETMAERIPTAEPLLADLFAAFYRHAVAWAPGGAPDPAVSVHRPILERIVSAEATHRLREATAGRLDESLMVVEAVARRLVESLPYEFADLQDAEAEYRARREEITEEISEIEAMAGIRPRRGEPTKAEREERIAALTAEAAKLEHDQKTDIRLVQLRAGVEHFMDGADIAGSIEEAGREIDAFAGAMAALGDVESPTLSTDDRIALFRRFRGSPALRRAVDLVGRARYAAGVAHRARPSAPPAGIAGLEPTDDPTQALPSELALIGDPVGETEFLRRFAEGELLRYRFEPPKEQGAGPVIVIIDESASMAGEPAHMAKAIGVAMADVAAADGRHAAIIEFSGPAELRVTELPVRGRDPRVVAELIEHFFGGGTDFDGPIGTAIEMVYAATYDAADIVVITDGQGTVAPGIATKLAALRADRDLRLFHVAVGIDGGAMAEIADAVWSDVSLSEEAPAHAVLAALVNATHREGRR